jgi:phosphate transport system permease protein
VNRNRRRQISNALARAFMYLTAALALLPLSLVLIYTVAKGLPAIKNVEFFVNSFRPVGIPGGGIANALIGTVIMVAIASAMAIPVGVIAGIQLAEYRRGQVARWVRLSCDVMVGTPSIVIGLFVFALFVAPFHHYSGLAGSIALAILMLPIVVRTTESAVVLVPHRLRESGLALGIARWRVALQLVLPAAVPGVITGALLAVARAAGETAPLLFTAFGNQAFNLNPTGPMEALPLVVYHNALTPFPDLVQQAWGAALVLILLTLLVNVASRLALRRQIALAGKL